MQQENPPEHVDMINKFLDSKEYGFMLTIARDGEYPARSIYHFNNAIDAVSAYNRYDNFGFSKEYLTVCLYESSKQIHKKVLKRPPAGECSYVKQNYKDASKLLNSFKDELNEDQYKRLVGGFALIFSQDNIRFNSSRFFEDCNCEEVVE
jgi:hypothetical protein